MRVVVVNRMVAVFRKKRCASFLEVVYVFEAEEREDAACLRKNEEALQVGDLVHAEEICFRQMDGG